MRPRCSILTGGFDFSGCGDCTSCPPFEHTEMSNREPSAIVLQGIPCMCGLYKVSMSEISRPRRTSQEPGVAADYSREVPVQGIRTEKRASPTNPNPAPPQTSEPNQ